jgi:hypothetical protein
MVPLEVTHTALATPAVLQRIMHRQTPFLQLMQKLLLFFAQTYKEVFSFEHPPLHDPLAVFYVACPSAFTVRLHSSTSLERIPHPVAWPTANSITHEQRLTFKSAVIAKICSCRLFWGVTYLFIAREEVCYAEWKVGLIVVTLRR